MRLPLKEKGKNREPILLLNKFNNDLREAFEDAVKRNIVSFGTKVMLADFSVIDINSFDPNHIVNLFITLEKSIGVQAPEWQVVGVQSTKSDDLRRIYLQFSTEIEKFYFYVYMGIQFHSLFYYQVDKEVINISKKIRELENLNNNTKSEITIEGDKIIREELERLGYKEVDNSQLFEELFTKSELSAKLIEKASEVEEKHPSLDENDLLISKLKKQLETFIIEAYQFSLASLDQNKMLQGEEGMVVYVDFEMIKNKKTKEKTSVINFENLSAETLAEMKKQFDDILRIFTII
ncbi:MAG: hypothetical protein M3Y25_07285 [Thermoproteota archaeon]|nr:hypothetical protein [Thermoproteota archaeon]